MVKDVGFHAAFVAFQPVLSFASYLTFANPLGLCSRFVLTILEQLE